MTDFIAFNEWLWSCDPRLAAQVQQWHDTWTQKVVCQQGETFTKGMSFIVDDRYCVEFIGSERDLSGGMALYSLLDRPSSLIAVFQTPTQLFSELLTHSLRRSGPLTLDEFASESARLVSACRRAWASVTGEAS